MSNDNKKHNLCRDSNVMNMYAKFQLHLPYCSWEEDVWINFRKFTLYVAMATNQIQRSGQNP